MSGGGRDRVAASVSRSERESQRRKAFDLLAVLFDM
jgi:hypothetical protein